MPVIGDVVRGSAAFGTSWAVAGRHKPENQAISFDAHRVTSRRDRRDILTCHIDVSCDSVSHSARLVGCGLTCRLHGRFGRNGLRRLRRILACLLRIVGGAAIPGAGGQWSSISFLPAGTTAIPERSCSNQLAATSIAPGQLWRPDAFAYRSRFLAGLRPDRRTLFGVRRFLERVHRWSPSGRC